MMSPDPIESRNDELSSPEFRDNGSYYPGFGDNRISTQENRNNGLSPSANNNDNSVLCPNCSQIIPRETLIQTPQSLEKNPPQTTSSTADQIRRDGRTKKYKAITSELNQEPNRRAMVEILSIEEENDAKVQKTRAELERITADTRLDTKDKLKL